MAAGAFAIDFGNGLTAAGEVKAGIGVSTEDDGNDDTTDTKISAWNNDAGQILRTRLTAAYTGDWGGAKIRFQSIGWGGDSGASFVTKYAFGWANFLDKKIVVYGGDIGEDVWGLGKLSINAFDPNLDAIKGVRAEFKVVDGLSFGFALPLDPVTYYTYGTGWTAKTSDGATLGNTFGRAIIGGVYNSGLFSVAAGIRLYPAIDSKEYGGKPSGSDYAESSSYVDVIAGVEVHPIEPLKIGLDARFDTQRTDKDLLGWAQQVGYTRVGLKAQYDVTSQLNVHLLGTVFVPGESIDEDEGGTEGTIDGVSVTKADNFKGQGDYGNVEKLGDAAIAPRIGVDYKVTDTIGAYFQLGSDNILFIGGDKDKGLEGAGVYVKLGGKITLGTSSIEIFDKINKIGADDKKVGTEDVSPITNQFQIDFNWVF